MEPAALLHFATTSKTPVKPTPIKIAWPCQNTHTHTHNARVHARTHGERDRLTPWTGPRLELVD
eukprot:2521726-Prorocentrum_lima.AAC.1